ncbi:unnamed protein product [Larinioides sclopetarius]|uniref:Alpha-latrotoxin n=1 Tax=Larinioides sclopetarius TaxID=280406 RepID=A0AAV2BUY0_9ARAC
MKVIVADTRNDKGYTLLHISAFSGSLDVTRYLISEKANINAVDKKNRKPVHIAVESGFKDIVEFYLNCKNLGTGITSILLLAANRGKANICELLIQRNADLHFFHMSDETPVNLMPVKSSKEVLSVFLNYGAYYNARPSPLLELTKDNDAASVFRKLDKLFAAVKNNSESEVESLLSSEVREETSPKYCFANGKCVRKETVLHYASWKGYKEIINILLKYNTNPNVRAKTVGIRLCIMLQSFRISG